MNMKIVCLIKNRPAGIYMVNSVHKEHELSLVIVENLKSSANRISLPHRLLYLVLRPKKIFKYLKKKVLRKDKKDAFYYASIHDRYFENIWQKLDDSIPVMYVDDINSEKVYDRLKEISPDLILDKGTSVVKDHILETAKLALNAHSGLSPYYRGAYCTKWGLINWDPYNIGVTIHKLSKVIDGGDILIQKRAVIKPDDSAYTIDLQLGVLGTQLYIEIINKLKEKNTLVFKKQDLSHGYITNGRQWNDTMEKAIHYIEKNALIGVMLEKPARRHKLPIIEEL
jgi:folate-dependent phosphoribosylglycinamide formyltransferase PurN